MLYNWAFFTVLGYSPFLMQPITPQQLGLVFCGWGVFVAIFAIWGAPWFRRHLGTARTLYVNFVIMAVDVAVIGIFWDQRTVVITAVIVSGIFVGMNNTLVTTAVMSTSPVERPVASATYNFVRFIGGGLAPFVASKLVERYNATLPFVIGALCLVAAAGVLSTVNAALGSGRSWRVAHARGTGFGFRSL